MAPSLFFRRRSARKDNPPPSRASSSSLLAPRGSRSHVSSAPVSGVASSPTAAAPRGPSSLLSASRGLSSSKRRLSQMHARALTNHQQQTALPQPNQQPRVKSRLSGSLRKQPSAHAAVLASSLVSLDHTSTISSSDRTDGSPSPRGSHGSSAEDNHEPDAGSRMEGHVGEETNDPYCDDGADMYAKLSGHGNIAGGMRFDLVGEDAADVPVAPLAARALAPGGPGWAAHDAHVRTLEDRIDAESERAKRRVAEADSARDAAVNDAARAAADAAELAAELHETRARMSRRIRELEEELADERSRATADAACAAATQAQLSAEIRSLRTSAGGARSFRDRATAEPGLRQASDDGLRPARDDLVVDEVQDDSGTGGDSGDNSSSAESTLTSSSNGSKSSNGGRFTRTTSSHQRHPSGIVSSRSMMGPTTTVPAAPIVCTSANNTSLPSSNQGYHYRRSVTPNAVAAPSAMQHAQGSVAGGCDVGGNRDDSANDCTGPRSFYGRAGFHRSTSQGGGRLPSRGLSTSFCPSALPSMHVSGTGGSAANGSSGSKRQLARSALVSQLHAARYRNMRAAWYDLFQPQGTRLSAERFNAVVRSLPGVPMDLRERDLESLRAEICAGCSAGSSSLAVAAAGAVDDVITWTQFARFYQKTRNEIGRA